MLTIRNEQIALLRSHFEQQFEVEAATHLWKFFPQPCASIGSADEMRFFVHQGIRQAAGNGIKEEGAVLAFLECIVQYGLQFERSVSQEWIAAVIRHPVLPGYVKVEAIRDRLLNDSGGRVLVRF